MKRRDVFQSTYLGKDDIQRPTMARISRVHLEQIKGEHGMEQKAVADFAENNLKPMILNNFNWSVLEDAYGDESDFWTGKPVEIFVDPNVMFGAKRVGGLRLRIPNTNTMTNGHIRAWTFDQCIDHCAAVGISKDTMIAHLKSKGNTSFNSIRDTPVIEALMASVVPQDPFAIADPPPQGDEIPF